MGYEGHLQPLLPGPDKEKVVTQAMEWLIGSKRMIEQEGIPVKIVSCGGTGDYQIAGQYPGNPEPGGVISADGHLVCAVCAGFQACPQCSRYGHQQNTWRAGCCGCRGKGNQQQRGLPTIKGTAGWRVKALHAEHAPIELLDSAAAPEVGDKIELAVQYHDGTVHLHQRHVSGSVTVGFVRGLHHRARSVLRRKQRRPPRQDIPHRR